MSHLSIDDLLAPLADGEPCGVNLDHAPEFFALLTAAQGKPERWTGKALVPAELPRWPEVHEAALVLARRTRDLRLAVLLARAGAHTRGLAGYADGLALVAGLLERHWDGVHPQLDADDGGDATMRLFALAPLCDAVNGLAELRACTAAGPAHPLTMRMIELAWTNVDPAKGESRPTQPALAEGLRVLGAADGALLDRMRAVDAAARSIDKSVSQRAGTAGPDFKPLLQLTGAIAEAAAVAGSAAAANAQANGGDGVAPGSAGAVTAPGQIGSREDVVRMLGAVCDWIENHEPTNPAPLLIRRAQRLMSKSFLDLVRDLAPDGLKQVEQIAGVAVEA